MNVLLGLVLAAALCALLLIGLASVLGDLLRRDVRFSETPPSHLARKDYRIAAGAAAGAPARNAACETGSHANVIGNRD